MGFAKDYDSLEKFDVTTPPAGKTVLVDVHDLSMLAAVITAQTKQFVYNCVIPDGQSAKLLMIEHPVTNQIIVAAPEWKKRKAVLEYLSQRIAILAMFGRTKLMESLHVPYSNANSDH